MLEHLRDEPAVPRLAGPTAQLRRSRRAPAHLARGPSVGGCARRPGEPGPHRRAGRSRAGRLRASRRCAATTRGTCATRPTSESSVPALDHLPHQVIHNDANEHNVLVADDGAVTGLIDFGDVVWTARVCGLAVAGAYAMQGRPDPARAVVPVVRGYHEVTPLRAGRARGPVRADGRAAADERRDGGAAVRGGAGQRVPADQPDGREGDARAARARGRAARPLPVPRRVRLRGEPERAPRTAVARAASKPPR